MGRILLWGDVMAKRTVVNLKDLQRKSLSLDACKIGNRSFRVESNDEWLATTYIVTIRRFPTYLALQDLRYVGATCTCDWGTYSGEGCSHVLAAMRKLLVDYNKIPSFWSTKEAAERQKRPYFKFGKGMWVTLRDIDTGEL